MTRFASVRAGMRVLGRHLRNSRGRPDRLFWVLRRSLSMAASGKLGGMLERHVVVDELYADYPGWIARYDTLDDAARARIRARIEKLPMRPKFSVVMPTYNTDPAELEAAIQAVRTQLYPDWELIVVDDASTDPRVPSLLREIARKDTRILLALHEQNGGIAAATNAALALARGDYIAFLDHDDLIAEQALYRMAEAIAAHPRAALLYSDEDKLDRAGRRCEPHFKPDWNPEWAKTTNFVLHLCVVRADAMRAIGGMRAGIDGAQDWDLLLRLAERHGDDAIVHLPRVLYHWRMREGSTAAGVYQKPGIETLQYRVLGEMLARRRISADVESTVTGWWIRYRVPEPPPLVSIVIPTRDRAEMLRRCLQSVFERTRYPNFELVIVDHASEEPAARELLQKLALRDRVTVVRYDGPFNYARECNLGVAQSRGTVVVLLNNDTEVISPWWLDELAGHALQPGTGLVGALLLYPDDTIQHAGVFLGVNGTADRPYLGQKRGYTGIAGRAAAAQDVTAVITACAAIARERFDAVGGFDETFAVSHNDDDLCLRLIERGFRNVITPHAELYHHESASRGYDNSAAQQAIAHEEDARFRACWREKLAEDPYYSPNLANRGRLFALAEPPRVAD